MPGKGGTGGLQIQYLNNDVLRLYLFAKINPAMWDAIIPQGPPKYSKATLNVIAAQVIKTIANSIKEPFFKEGLNKLGSELFTSGTRAMSYEDDDWRCGNEPLPIPHSGITASLSPGEEVELNPQPLPPRYFGGLLKILAESVSNNGVAAGLNEIANQMTG